MASAPQQVWGDLATTAFVESSLLFKTLDDEARRDVLHVAQLVTFAPGERASGPGDDGLFLVRDGTAAIQVGGVETSVLERGAIFGVSRVLGIEARPWTLVARTAVTAVVLPTAVVAALAERFPRIRKLLEAVLAAREKEAAARLAS